MAVAPDGAPRPAAFHARELVRAVREHFRRPPKATRTDLIDVGRGLRQLDDYELGDLFLRLLWAATE